MSRDWHLRIEDILECLARIAEYTQGLNEETFAANSLVFDAVIRNLEVIGEAARHIPDSVQSQYSDIPWAEMKGMRNLLIHEYFGVSLPIVWATVQNNLPPLRRQLRRLLDSSTNH